MEAVGLVASLAQLINITAKTIKYLNSVKEASKERASLYQEASSLLPLLVRLQTQINEAKQFEPWFDCVRALGVENGPLDQLREALVALTKKLKPKSGVEKAVRAFIWTFDNAYCESILQKIERVKSMAALALQGDTFKLAQAIKADTAGIDIIKKGVAALADDIEAIHLSGDQEKRQEILDWFSPLNFFKTQQDVFARRQEGTGQWLIDLPAFQDWLSGSERILCCPGIPGAGKTIMASVVIDFLRTNQQKTADLVGVAGIYCNFKEREMQSPQNLLAGACVQLIQGSIQPLPNALTGLHMQHKTSRTRPSWEEVNQIFDIAVKSHHTVFVVIDAIDECSEQVRNIFVPRLNALPDNVRILITTRPIDEITRRFPRSPKIEIRASDVDLTKYIKSRIASNERLTRHVRAQPNLKKEICTQVKAKADGMFLAAKLHVDSLSAKTSVKALKKALDNLSSTLDELYDDALQRIDKSQSQDDRALAEKALRWVAYAYRPLSAPMLQEAVAIDSEETDYDAEAMPAIGLILDVCSGLLIVDEEAGVVRLVHYTAQDYFDKLAGSKYLDAHASIAGECLTYLNYDTLQSRTNSVSDIDNLVAVSNSDDEDVSSAKTDLVSNNHDAVSSGEESSAESVGEREKFPVFEPHYYLLTYASAFWALHSKARPPGRESELGNQISKFLESKPRSVMLGPGQYDGVYSVSVRPSELVIYPGYGIAAFFGMSDSLRDLLPHVDDIDACLFRTYGDVYRLDLSALHLAAYNNQATAVEILLENGANTECNTSRKETSLHVAIRNISVAAATALVDGGANVMATDEDGNTPIALADWQPPVPFVEFLWNAGAKIQQRDIFHLTRLMESVIRNGDIETVRWLFDHAMIDPRNKPIQSHALLNAVHHGSIVMVEILLEHGADINSRDSLKQETCLHRACTSESLNRLEVIQLLLDRGIDVDAQNNMNRTALHLACMYGEDDITVALLQHGADINERSRHGKTALHDAIQYGHLEIALALIQHGADIDIQDSNRCTALYRAANHGHTEVALALLQHGADIDIRDWKGRTALHMAIHNDHTDVALVLLQHGANVHIQYSNGITALHMAIDYGHTDVALALLQHGADIDIQDSIGRTALHMASATGQSRIVDELVRRHATVGTKSRCTVTWTYPEFEASFVERHTSPFISDVGCGDATRAKFIVLQDATKYPWWASALHTILLEKEKVLEGRVWPRGMTALDIAILRKNEDIIHLLKPLTELTEEKNAPSVDQYLCKVFQVSSFDEVLGKLERIGRTG